MADSEPSAETLALCAKCGVEKPLTAFYGRQKTCIDCVSAARARTLERKEAVAYSPELGTKICDLIAMRTPVAKIAEMAGMPTARQMASWRRQHPDFRDAYDLAREQRADARSDRVDEILDDLRAGKIDAPSARVLIEAELKLAAKENPGRYGDATQIDLTSAGKPLHVDVGAALKALLDALPQQAALPPPIDLEATEVPEGATLQ